MPKTPTSLEWKELILVLLLLSKNSMGRYRLAEMMGTSKARTRSILEFLTNSGLVISKKGRGGSHLSNRGEKIVQTFNRDCFIDFDTEYISIPKELLPENKIAVPCFLNIKNPTTTGLYERDLVVREGGDGSITLVNERNIWKFADSDDTHSVDLQHNQILHPYSLAILAFGENYSAILNGLGAVIDYYLEDIYRDLFELK